MDPSGNGDIAEFESLGEFGYCVGVVSLAVGFIPGVLDRGDGGQHGLGVLFDICWGELKPFISYSDGTIV